MSLIVSEVYDALIEAGATKEKARAAAGAVPFAEGLATREDIAKLEAATAERFAKLEAAPGPRQVPAYECWSCENHSVGSSRPRPRSLANS